MSPPSMDPVLTWRVEGDLLEIGMAGNFPVAASENLIQRAFADPRVPERVRVLVDASASTISRSAEEMREIAWFFQEFAPRIERIAVVTNRDVHYGLIRLASAYAESGGITSSPFRTRAEALEWLGASAP